MLQVPPCFPRRTKWMKSRSSVGLWWCCIAHLWGLIFREEGRPRGNLRPRRLLSTLASRDLWWKFQLHLNSSLDLRKASNSANAQLTVCSQRLLRCLLQSSSQFMLPKVLASLESQRPSGFVTWLWSNNFEIECSVSRWITPLGIKTTFVSRAALFQWRRDACRSWKGISRSLWVFSPPPPLHVHTFCASWLLPSLSATRPLVQSQRNCLEIRPCGFSMFSPCGRHWEQGTRGFTLAVDPLTRSSCRTEVSIPTYLLLPGAPPAGDLQLNPCIQRLALGGWGPNPLATVGPALKGRPSSPGAGPGLCCDCSTAQAPLCQPRSPHAPTGVVPSLQQTSSPQSLKFCFPSHLICDNSPEVPWEEDSRWAAREGRILECEREKRQALSSSVI